MKRLIAAALLALALIGPARASCFTPTGPTDAWTWRDDGTACGVWIPAPYDPPAPTPLPGPSWPDRAWLPLISP